MSNPPRPEPAHAATTTADTVDASVLLRRFGGWRGVLDGALPTTVFLLARALLGDGAQVPLLTAAAAAITTALGVTLLRLWQGATWKPAVGGLTGVALAAAFAAWTGDARDYFVPGIWVDAAYGVAFALSAVLGRPLVGYVCAAVFGLGPGWRQERRLRRTMLLATWGWAGVFAVRATVQAVLYQADRPELLGLAKLALGWPLTTVAVLLTVRVLRAARTARRGHCPPDPAQGG